MESPLAVTKIILPSKRSYLLSRPRLVDFLHQHIERKLILVSASAGYGKTSLLIDFAHETSLPVCWLSLDTNDNDPRVFLEYLIASLQRQFPDFGSRTSRLLSEAGLARDTDVIAGSLVTEIHEDIPTYFVLMLDDYQLVEESAGVNRILDALLRLLPENAHIVLSGRTLPNQLTLTRLAARQEIAGLGMNELKFSPAEIRALVKQNLQVDLSEQDAINLAENSEGWITGILLTTQSMWQGLFRNLVRVPGSHSQLFNYLASEVFAQQLIKLQQFLLGSAILNQLNSDICNNLLAIQDAESMLREVEQKNLFITRIDEGESWYRYHHLFQEFLESRLRETDPMRWEELHRRAAKWFESRRAWEQAIRHHLKIGSFENVARVVDQVAKATFDAGHWTTLAKWIDTLPGEVIRLRPSLTIWRARIFGDMGEIERALELYSHALARFEELGNKDGIGRTLVREAICLRFQGSYEQAIEYSQRALTLLNATSKREIAEAHRTIGISNGLRGNWEECTEELTQALGFYDANTDHADVALIHQDLGVARRTLGDPNAEKHFQLALDHWHLAHNSMGLANTLNSVGVSYHRQGEYAKAIETLKKAQDEAHQSGQMRIEAHALASLGDVYRDQGAFLRAQETYRSAYEIARQINEGFLITYILCALGETLHLTGDVEHAEQLLSQALELAESHHSNYERGLAKTALGIFSYEKGNIPEAEDHLTDAVELFEQGGAKRDIARVHLHLAKANFLRRNYRQVNKHLQVTADLGKRLHEDQFIVADGPRVLPVIRHAVSKKIENSYFARALQKIEPLPVVDVDEKKQIADSKPQIKAYAFGTARVSVNEKQVTTADWGSASAKELFFLLLANPRGLRKEEILEKLWQDVSAPKASAIFHSTAHRARRALLSDCIVYENGVYRLNGNLNLWNDVVQLNQLVSRALDANSDDEGASLYRQAIALYQGDYFEDSYSDWCIPIRTALHSKHIDALHALANYHDQKSQNNEALALYRKIIERDPLREEVYREMMRIQGRIGDRSGAIKTYEQCVHTLNNELNLVPSEETRILYQQILTGNNIH